MSTQRPTPRKPTGKIRRGSRAWSDLIRYLEAQHGGVWAITCGICRRGAHQIGVHPSTGRPLWQLDHTTPLLHVDPHNEGIDADQLLADVRWLCRDCNLRRGAGRTDTRVRQLNARAQQRPRTTNTTTTQTTASTWNLQPPTTKPNDDASLLMRRTDPPGAVFDQSLPVENPANLATNNPLDPRMARMSTNNSEKLEPVSGGGVR